MGRKTQAARVPHGATGTHAHTQQRGDGVYPTYADCPLILKEKTHKKIKSAKAGLPSKELRGVFLSTELAGV